nr:hypothetical protein [Rhodococcus pyridinivorans]
MRIPFTVRARLSAGYAHGTPWGLSLDGLLASEIWETRKAAARAKGRDWVAYDVDRTPQEIDLPLDRCCSGGGKRWHWSATFAYPEDELPGPHVQNWISRQDQSALAQMASKLPKHISERKDRYRVWVMPLPLTIAPSLTWRAVGDPVAVSELLQAVVAIGKKRASGHGLVLEWEITPEPEADPWEFSHLHPDGSLGRTAPAECLRGRSEIPHGGHGHIGLRPPYMHPLRRFPVTLPAR